MTWPTGMERGQKLRFVTLLTFIRFPLVLMFSVLAILRWAFPAGWLFFTAFLVLVLAGLTDLLDGYFARRMGVETPFGAYADPLMDKFYYLCTLPALTFLAAVNRHFPHAVALLVLTLFFLMRDLWVTFLRTIGAAHGVNPAAHWIGKLRTAIAFPLICVIYWHEQAPASLQILPVALLYGAEALAFLANLLSVHIYTRRYWSYLRRVADSSSF
ncbi:MAG: CDP-alcohol phosphatidyltransferase family protein [Kiritimatiellia bacterium]